MVTWGSEALATKVALGHSVGFDGKGAADDAFEDGFRYDLDDVSGEIVHLAWGNDKPVRCSSVQVLDNDGTKVLSEVSSMPLKARPRRRLSIPDSAFAQKAKQTKSSFGVPLDDEDRCTTVMRYGRKCLRTVRVTNIIEGRDRDYRRPFMTNVLRMGGNQFVQPLPPMRIADPVGNDIRDIPAICRQIQDDWNEPSESLNRLTAFTLLTLLRKRLLQHHDSTHDGSVDLLITGCEVSLWIGEQFASDLHNAFPVLKIVTLSANKLLAQLGQSFAMPNTVRWRDSRAPSLARRLTPPRASSLCTALTTCACARRLGV